MPGVFRHVRLPRQQIAFDIDPLHRVGCDNHVRDIWHNAGVINERDIWRAANVLIQQYGDTASLHAAQRADELLEKGDMEGRRQWQRIYAAIAELLRDRPSNDESIQ